MALCSHNLKQLRADTEPEQLAVERGGGRERLQTAHSSSPSQKAASIRSWWLWSHSCQRFFPPASLLATCSQQPRATQLLSHALFWGEKGNKEELVNADQPSILSAVPTQIYYSPLCSKAPVPIKWQRCWKSGEIRLQMCWECLHGQNCSVQSSCSGAR